jgi:hypothetical protein
MIILPIGILGYFIRVLVLKLLRINLTKKRNDSFGVINSKVDPVSIKIILHIGHLAVTIILSYSSLGASSTRKPALAIPQDKTRDTSFDLINCVFGFSDNPYLQFRN